TLAQLLMPFAPHIAEEIWEGLGGGGYVSLAPWPAFRAELTVENTATIGVQVSGKLRGSIEISLGASEEEALELARKIVAVQNALEGKTLKKVIYKPGQILNLIAN